MVRLLKVSHEWQCERFMVRQADHEAHHRTALPFRYAGRRVDCQVTICHRPPLLAYTSVNRTPNARGAPFDVTLIWATPVRTTTSPRSCAFTSEGSTAV